MMRQYLDIKKDHPDDILFFRMGDFYEMFFDDAAVASRILDIALTARQNDIPMCGIPHHAAENYISRLIHAGKRVAVCEQMETVPSQGSIVKREVVRVITPGTVYESSLLEDDTHNFLGSLVLHNDRLALSFVDVSTGDFLVKTIAPRPELFRGELSRYNPKEMVIPKTDGTSYEVYLEALSERDIPLYPLHQWLYDTDYVQGLMEDIFGIASSRILELDSTEEIQAAGAILQYLQDTQRQQLPHLKLPRRLSATDVMTLDEATIHNLELLRNQHDRTSSHTLYSVLNHTKTPMGKRYLEMAIVSPLLSIEEIEQRLDRVEFLHSHYDLRESLRKVLGEVLDVERILSRLSFNRILPSHFLSLAQSLEAIEKAALLLKESAPFATLVGKIPDSEILTKTIRERIADEPALSPEQGAVIRRGFHGELDRLYSLKDESKNWILEYQEEEKKRLGISTLKIRYNKILGYYIEVSKGQAAACPDEYIRKQTLVGSERFTTEKLQDFERDILTASDQILSLEKELIEELRARILEQRDELQQAAAVTAEIDYYQSLAFIAAEGKYVRPRLSVDGTTEIHEGRHPVVEKYFTREIFIPNNIHFSSPDEGIAIITGPNMSGKSTYIRMTALIQLMAQMGSYVPASSAQMSLADRIFTRVGASDNIARGESTFLVEMNETAIILNNATDRSLIIMDEIGRGTSTYDGLSIAWGVVEYIHHYLRSRTLFATHYHELTELGMQQGIVNYNVEVKEGPDGVEFLHRVIPGAADRSYGIHVAQLAGLPSPIIERSEEILAQLEQEATRKPSSDRKRKKEDEKNDQLSIFNAANHRVIQAIKNINPDSITPLEALQELARLKKLVD